MIAPSVRMVAVLVVLVSGAAMAAPDLSHENMSHENRVTILPESESQLSESLDFDVSEEQPSDWPEEVLIEDSVHAPSSSTPVATVVTPEFTASPGQPFAVATPIRNTWRITPPLPEAVLVQATERFFFGQVRPHLPSAIAALRGLQPQEEGPMVKAWTEVLWDLGFWGPDAPLPTDQQDESFREAVQRAQYFYGLTMDGVPGSSLLLNLQENAWMEGAHRWWTSVVEAVDHARAQGSPLVVMVNIPSYHLQVWQVEPMQLLMESRVIVGAPHRKTPRMTTAVANLKLNPDWSPPPSMKGKRYAPPGPNNPLGHVRFSTVNAGNIYLHDTNDHSLFDKPTRALSSGCVRVESWRELSLLLSGLTPEELDAQLSPGRTVFHEIPDVPVIIGYSEYAVVNGQLGRHPDVYRLGAGR